MLFKKKPEIEKFKLVTPTIEYKDRAINYIKEHYKYGSRINGAGRLYDYLDNYEEWLKKIEEQKKYEVTISQVPSETYFLVRENDDKIVGMINIRTKLNERMKKSGGNIGYGIRPKERRKGYNKINLYLALLKCQKYGIKNVILSCRKDNIGSSKTMKALGGYYDREIYSIVENCIIEFYRIDVDYAVETYRDKYEKYISESYEV
ncbi:MAG: GNAT family N-acetyltransferase [Clostridia bacterium]|nr:GNAT family N-acetyltransferase [Clostridia bacterium]